MDININLNFRKYSKRIKLNFILIGILLLATFLRFYNLDFQGVWLDEMHTLKEADPDWTLKMLHEVNMFREGIPHLYFLIVRSFGIIFGHSIYSVRLVSVLFGILSVYSIYLVGKNISTKQTGFIASFLLAIHPFHIEYSQEGRSYSMLIFFVIVAFYRLLLFTKNCSLKNAVYLGLFSGLITNAHPVGIVSVISIYILVALHFLTLRTKIERIKYIKFSFLSGIVTLLVFAPVYQKVVNASALGSFWVQKPTYDYVIYVLNNIAGGNITLLTIFLFSIILLLVSTIFTLFKRRDFRINNNLRNFLLILIWVVFYFLFILVKSLGPSSLMLSRYLTPILPGLLLSAALTISIFKNTIIKIICTLLIAILLLHSSFIQKDYYHTIVKTQFNDLSLQVIEKNKSNEIIVSNWGWLLAYFLDKDAKLNNVYEKNLDVYINDVKAGTVEEENFWYMDGNSRPYSVSPETQEFLDKNYSVAEKIDLYDCWAKHYISKKMISKTDIILKLNQFNNAKFDGSGNLMFFENSKSSSLPMILNKGDYEIQITSMSLPKDKINNENAKFTVFINDKNYGTFEANEHIADSHSIIFTQELSSKFQIEIIFINDFADGVLDRNLVISKIQIERK